MVAATNAMARKEPMTRGERLLRTCRCGACGGSMQSTRHVSLVEMDLLAEWPFPAAGDLLTGIMGRAVAVICDACANGGATIKEVVEFGAGTVIYHPVGTLKKDLRKVGED